MQRRDLGVLQDIDHEVNPSPWTELQFSQGMDAGHIGLVFEEDGVPSGFLVVSVVLDEASLLNIAVRPTRQSRGIAGALLKEMSKSLAGQGVSRVVLEVRASNRSAIGFYEKVGFDRIACRENYYPSAQGREDALIYAKDLIALQETNEIC
jgi:ribosomal-protein-alanine N-acetyltransferase